MLLTIYVPKPEGRAAERVAPASAVVGDPENVHDGRVLCHFEGNLHGAANIACFADKLVHAAGRLARSYGTIAQGRFRLDELVEVGFYDTERWAVTSLTRPEILAAWAGEPAERILGVRLPEGDVDWNAAVGAMQEGAVQIGRSGGRFRYRTRAGQVIAFDPAAKRATVEAFAPEVDPTAAMGPRGR